MALLPLEYAFRNLLRRPVRTALTLTALSVVILIVFVVVGFMRGLEKSLEISGDSQVVLVYSINSGQNIESSSITANVPALIAASLRGIEKRFGIAHISPEMFMGTRMRANNQSSGFGLVRGVESTACLVRRSVRIVHGNWPGSGEVMIGNLVGAKLGMDQRGLQIGDSLEFEGRSWKISGEFSAAGGAFEAEVWCNLSDLQHATKRQDLGLVALRMASGKSPSEVQLFCKERLDLELQAQSETAYFGQLQTYFRPVRILAWIVVLLVSSSGILAGLNTMFGAVAGRVRELATLQAIGYRRRAILISLLQEGVVLAVIASTIAGCLSLLIVHGSAIRFSMGAFRLQIDGVAMSIGCVTGFVIGVLGALPPAIKALRIEVAQSLKAV